jgi:hypothetical protein
MLMLRSQRPEPVKVVLPGAAFVMVRAATTADVDRARSEIQALIAGVAASEDSLSLVSMVLGEEFQFVDLTDFAKLEQVTRGLSRLKLAFICCEAWDGIGDESGEPLPLTLENLALLLRDSAIASAIDRVVEAKVHIESAEKNGSAASRDGEAAADKPTAPNAGAQKSDALGASPDQLPENSAPKSSTLQ